MYENPDFCKWPGFVFLKKTQKKRFFLRSLLSTLYPSLLGTVQYAAAVRARHFDTWWPRVRSLRVQYAALLAQQFRIFHQSVPREHETGQDRRLAFVYFRIFRTNLLNV
jgi:hypothetical protein